MNLNIFYLQNDTGKILFKILQSELDKVICREIQIDASNYMAIDLPDENSNSTRILNTPRAINNCIKKEFIFSVLDINRIAYDGNSEETIIRSYEILICDLASISIKVTTYGKSKEKEKYIKENDNNKVVEMAKRTVYTLGLDIAMVKIVLTGKRRYKVKEVDTSPILRKKDVDAVVKTIKKIYSIDRFLNTATVKLGADPEFMLFNTKNGKMISASQFFPRDGIVGCDNIRIPNRQQRPVAEIRPKPDTSPIKVIANIKHALNNAYRLAPYRNIKWIAGSQPVGGYSIGGHIHFSNIKLNYDILRALDNYIGISVFLIENPVTAAKRRKKYGYLGDYRIKDYGGFEYRTPGSWLVSPNIATAVLCLAKIVASRYPQLPKKYLRTFEAQKAFYEGKQDFFKTFFDDLWANLENIDMYGEYERELQIIPYMVRNSLCWDESNDFRNAWKLFAMTKKKYYNKKSPGKSSQRGTNTSSNNEVNTTWNSSNINLRSGERSTGRGLISTRSTDRNSRNSTVNIESFNNENRRNNISPYGQIISSSQVRRNYVIR